MFIVIWQYKIHETYREAFEELYGQNGKWVQLFKTAAEYKGTQLIKDVSSFNQYVTIDEWESQEMYEKFLADHEKEFKAIDVEGENFTISEVKIGWYWKD